MKVTTAGAYTASVDDRLESSEASDPDMHNGVWKSYSMLHISCPGPEIRLPGRISDGFQSGRPRSRPAGRPKAGRRADSEAFPIRNRPKYGPEA